MRQALTYAVPEALVARVSAGSRVAVPLGPRRHVGVVVAVERETDVPPGRLRALLDVLDEEPVVDEELLGLTAWIAERYACAHGEALAAVLPAPLKRESGVRRVAHIAAAAGVGKDELEEIRERFPKQHRLLRTLLELQGTVEMREILRTLRLSESPARSLERRGWVTIEWVRAARDPLAMTASERGRPARLSPAQAQAVEAIERHLLSGEHRGFLLHGVTGSGKTEVYLRVIERALEEGRRPPSCSCPRSRSRRRRWAGSARASATSACCTAA